MAHVVADRVLETSTTTGTGALTLAGAVTGFQAFSAVCSTSDTVPYYIEAVDGSGVPTGEWETGQGTYSGANTLTRTTVYASSNSGSAVNLSAGTKRVGLGQLAANAAWTEIASATPTGVAVVDFSGLKSTAYNDLMVVFEGVSHDHGSNTSMTIAVSFDGSTFSAGAALAASIGATVEWWGGRHFPAFRSNGGYSFGAASNAASSPGDTSIALGSAWRCDGGIDALRVATVSGNFNAGTIRLMGR